MVRKYGTLWFITAYYKCKR